MISKVVITFALSLCAVDIKYCNGECGDKAAQTAAKSSVDSALAAFRQEVLKAHNILRANHDAPALVLDGKLNMLAQKHANKLAEKDTMEYITDSPYGQNVGGVAASHSSGGVITLSFYEGVEHYKDYKKEKGSFRRATALFTQTVWKNSRKIGVGVKRVLHSNGPFNNFDMVAVFYYPPGNVIGEFVKNVLPPKESLKDITKDVENVIKKMQEERAASTN